MSRSKSVIQRALSTTLGLSDDEDEQTESPTRHPGVIQELDIEYEDDDDKQFDEEIPDKKLFGFSKGRVRAGQRE